MKFYSGKITTGKSVTFEDFIKKATAAKGQSLEKTASSVESSAVKEANLSNFGDNKAAPFGKKDEKKEKKEDCDSSDKKEDCKKEADAEKEVKVASDCDEGCTDKDGVMKVKKQEVDPVGGTNTGKPEGEKKKSSIDAKTVTKKADNSEVPAENKGVKHQVDECCGAPTSGDGSEGSKKKEKKDSSEEKKAESSRFIRIANLDSKTKNEWKSYFKKLYPSAYVDAMFADK
jgi:hypothetical protein